MANQNFFMSFLGLAEFRFKNFSESKHLAESSLRICEEIQDSIGIARCVSTLGQIAMIGGEFSVANNYLMRSLKIAKKTGFLWLYGNAIKYLGHVALLNDDVAGAQKYFVQSLRIAHDLSLDRDIANHLYDFASLRVMQCKSGEGVKLLSFLLQRRASQQARLEGGRISDSAKVLLNKLEDEVPPEMFKTALNDGELLDVDEVVLELLGSHN